MAVSFLFDGPEQAKRIVLLAHGAGGPMDLPSLTATTKALAGSGFRVARFEFDYMAGRRSASGCKPPPRAEKLNPEYIAAIDALDAKAPLIIGGKSMGGRVASMVADDLFASVTAAVRKGLELFVEAANREASERRPSS
jgi:predicted alpha/beta-hydrolase family hydrolase